MMAPAGERPVSTGQPTFAEASSNDAGPDPKAVVQIQQRDGSS
jgi:hypothetical protein